MLEPVVARCRDLDISKYFRGDAAFAIPELYAFLEAENYLFASRLKSNAILERQIGHLLTRLVGHPLKKPVVRCHDLMDTARSRDRERRIVAKVEWHRGVRWVVVSCLPPRENFGTPRPGNKVHKAVGAPRGRCTIAEYGPPPCVLGDPADTCPADLDGDCIVGPFDLAVLLPNWGP